MDRISPLMAHRKHFLPFCFRNESRNSSKTSVDSIETVKGRLSPLIKFNCYSWNLKQVAIRKLGEGAERWKINEVKGFVNFNGRDSELIFRGVNCFIGEIARMIGHKGRVRGKIREKSSADMSFLRLRRSWRSMSLRRWQSWVQLTARQQPSAIYPL